MTRNQKTKAEGCSYIIGIDLGTTNCTLAFHRYDASHKFLADQVPEIQMLEIPQLLSSGTQGEKQSLPSFTYIPMEEELKAGTCALEWESSREVVVGEMARVRAEEAPDRVLASAKSWLCQDSMDRHSQFLPLHLEDSSKKMSPVQALAHYLGHLKEVWERKFPEAPFQEQMLLVTVPASFDPLARQMTEEAAKLAGYPEIILMEEPQAAFYSWLHKHSGTWRDTIKVGDQVLVVDVGGGTADFSLIRAEEFDGNVSLERVAVGEHLLLGGDNLDLALAYFMKAKFESEGRSIDDWQLQVLTHRCRSAKEQLLSEGGEDSLTITIPGRGSSLIGGALSADLSADEAAKLLVDGFMPLLKLDEGVQKDSRVGFQQIGLPFASDPRLSAHMASFLKQYKSNESLDLTPSAVLFNGGTMKSSAFRSRIVEQLNSWAKDLSEESVYVLDGAEYDASVSRGAVYYGLARLGQGVRVKSGTSRSYFVGIEDARPAIPGLPPSLKAMCVAPLGMEEGEERSLEDKTFTLILGEPVRFRFFSGSQVLRCNGDELKVGDSIQDWSSSLKELPVIETTLQDPEACDRVVNVRLKTRITELGMLELWAVSDNEREWKLEFDVRKEKSEAEVLVS